MSRVPEDVTAALTEAQIEQLRAAIGQARPWREHPVDIRVTVPLFARRLFVTLVGGAERRNPERRALDRAAHPLSTLPNLIFLGVGVVALYAIAGLVALVIASAVRG
jgi:hypothetical protein